MDIQNQLAQAKVKQLAVMRLDYNGSSHSAVSKFFADELSYALIKRRLAFDVIPTQQVDKALSDYQAKQQAPVAGTPASSTEPRQVTPSNSDSDTEPNYAVIGGLVASLAAIAIFTRDKGPLPKATHFLTGSIIDMGDQLQVSINILDKKNNIRAVARGFFPKTPSIVSLLDAAPAQSALTQPNSPFGSSPPISTGYSPPPAITQSWKNDALIFELQSCTQSGQSIECLMQVTARNYDVELRIYARNSTIYAAENQNEYSPSELIIADQVGVNSVSKKIIAGYNAKVVVRFAKINQRIRNLAAFELSCWAGNIGRFNAVFNSVPVN